ncbi:MAG TPA: TrmH family RNA methyltransferase, partial [Bacilli bacterium]|nr:TrmH family RNA methyltransferase [Bacilli bacterium]
LAKANDYKLVVTTLLEAQPLATLYKDDKIILVIGNEARGVSPSILTIADLKLKITMSNKIESLNAGIAASIIMHHHYSLKH